jgi:hypothetical protein
VQVRTSWLPQPSMGKKLLTMRVPTCSWPPSFPISSRLPRSLKYLRQVVPQSMADWLRYVCCMHEELTDVRSMVC